MPNIQQAEMKTALINYIKNRGSVSHVELCRDVPGFSGNDTAAHPNNVLLWQGVNLDFYNVLRTLIANDLIEAVVTSPFIYVIDGVTLSLPIAKRLDKVYKKPHWLPLIFNGKR